MSDAPAAAPAPAPASDSASTSAPAPAAAPSSAAAPPAAPAPAPAPAASTLLTDDGSKPGAGSEGDDDAGKPKDDGKPKTDDDKAKDEGAPPEYADFTLPENVKLDEPVMGEFKTIAKELNLSQAAAQRLVDLQVKTQQGNAQAFTQGLQQHVESIKTEWEKAAKADPEFGGEKFEESKAIAAKALETFGTPALKELLRESRLGSHPEVVRLLFKAGQAISQDGFVPGRAASADRSTADVLYGSATK